MWKCGQTCESPGIVGIPVFLPRQEFFTKNSWNVLLGGMEWLQKQTKNDDLDWEALVQKQQAVHVLKLQGCI